MVSHHSALARGAGPRASANRYRRLLEPIVRGRLGIVVAVAVLSVASSIGGRAGLAIGAVWVLVSGTYCLANFSCHGETHCAITGTGWTALALVGLAAVSIPGDGVRWLRVNALTLAYLVILGAGYAFEGVVAARAGRHSARAGSANAEAR